MRFQGWQNWENLTPKCIRPNLTLNNALPAARTTTAATKLYSIHSLHSLVQIMSLNGENNVYRLVKYPVVYLFFFNYLCLCYKFKTDDRNQISC